MRGFHWPLGGTRAVRAAFADVAGRLVAGYGGGLGGALVSLLLSAPLPARLHAQAPPASAAGTAVRTPAVQPVRRETETAMLRWGATVVWFRATDADSVLVFASASFRNPFAHPVAVSADDIDRWAAFAARLVATPGSGPESPTSASHVPTDSLPDTAHAILGAGDVVLETTSSSDGVALQMNIGANRQDGLLTTLFPDAAPAAAAALHDAARTARALHTTALAAAAAVAIPAPVSATATLRGSAPGAAVAGSVSPASSGVSAAALAAPTPGLMPVVVSATVSPATARPAATAMTDDRGTAGVDDVTVGNLVRQWQPELMYCYTEYGLRPHPELAGAVRVGVTLTPDGAVSHAAIVRRSWSGAGAADVESCIRTRVSAWRFPPASIASTHEFPLSFQR